MTWGARRPRECCNLIPIVSSTHTRLEGSKGNGEPTGIDSQCLFHIGSVHVVHATCRTSSCKSLISDIRISIHAFFEVFVNLFECLRNHWTISPSIEIYCSLHLSSCHMSRVPKATFLGFADDGKATATVCTADPEARSRHGHSISGGKIIHRISDVYVHLCMYYEYMIIYVYMFTNRYK